MVPVSSTRDWILSAHKCLSLRRDEQLLCTGSCDVNKTLKRCYPICLNIKIITLPSPCNGFKLPHINTRGKIFKCGTLQADSGLKKFPPFDSDETPIFEVANMALKKLIDSE